MKPGRSSPALDRQSRAWVSAAAGTALLPLLLQLPWMLAATTGVAAVLTAWIAWSRPVPALLRLVLAAAMLLAVFWVMGSRFGRDTGCGLLAVMLAIKPSETASLRDGRSLVGFALFAPFAAFLLDQGPTTMALGLLAALCALLALRRMADLEAGLAETVLPLRARIWALLRLIAVGLPLGLCVFWLFPRLAEPLWGVPERAVARPGLSDRMEPGQWIDLMADDSPVMRVQFFGPVPTPPERYWRGPVLLDFDGRTWTRPDWLQGLDVQPATRQAARWDYQVDVEPTDRRDMVALDLPLNPPEDLRLTHDYGLQTRRPMTALRRWRLQSAPPARFDAALPATLRQRALTLPSGFNPRTLALARQWRQEAGNDDAAIVNRAMRWINAEFAYTLDTPLPGRHGVDEFLFQYKQGFCQHFSSAFVVLMRGAGIPARVVTGYAGGVRNRIGGYWVVRRMDAHAWAEVWLQGRGWVRVDPTAAVAPERVYDTLEDRLAAGDAAEGFGAGFGSLRDVGDWLRSGWNNLVLGFDANRQQQLFRPLGLDRLDSARLGLIFAILASAVLLGMAWLLARGERERDPLVRAWHRVGRRYVRRGLGPEPHETAQRWAQRVARSDIENGPALLTLSERFAHARYARGVADAAALIRDLRRHRP
jgi:transglutaminase-like putative cysteine protease